MNVLGIHALVWVDAWSEEEARRAIRRTREAGYDLLEIPLLDPYVVDAAMTRRLLEQAGIAASCSLGLPFDADVSSADPAVAARGEAFLERAIQVSCVVMKVVLVVLALAFAPTASAGNVATPKMAAVASWAAGKPISVWCENDFTAWRALSGRYGYEGWGGFTIFAEPVVYIGPAACSSLTLEARLGPGLNILLHEAAHQRGFRDEALAECAARVLIYSALNRFYGVPWFSEQMRATTSAALEFSRSHSAEYQGGCDRL